MDKMGKYKSTSGERNDSKMYNTYNLFSETAKRGFPRK